MTSIIVAVNMVFTVGISCLIHCSFLIAFFPLVIVFISFSPSSFLFFSSVFFCILPLLLRRILLIVIMPAITRSEVINNHHRTGHPCGFDLHQFYPQSSPSSSVWLRLPGVNTHTSPIPPCACGQHLPPYLLSFMQLVPGQHLPPGRS